MEKLCQNCFFHDEARNACRDSITGLPVKEVVPADTCDDWMECETIPTRKPMKAYKVYDSQSCENFSTIVFAETARKARVAAMATDCCEDARYIDIRAIRVPEADKLYRGRSEIDWYNMEDRLALVRDFGWMCLEPSWECDGCECKPYCGHYEEEANG